MSQGTFRPNNKLMFYFRVMRMDLCQIGKKSHYFYVDEVNLIFNK